jgi:signal transduction histidine kinase
MLKFITNTITKGIWGLRTNSRLLFVVVLLFVFPIIFLWISEGFFDTARSNIATAEKNQVSILHDSLSFVLTQQTNEEWINKHLTGITERHPHITKIRVVSETDEGFLVVFANDSKLTGVIEKADDLYRSLPLTVNGSSFIYETTFGVGRVWQTFRKIETPNESLIIFSEHDFSVIDSIMSARRQNSYFGLTAIFLFLIGLAYWLNKQTDWEKKTQLLQNNMKQRDMFNNMIAHEIRTPITIIKGYSSFLLEAKNLGSENYQYVQNITSSSDRLLKLVNDFLEVARLQSGKLNISKEKTNLHDVVDQVVNDMADLAREKKLTLRHINLPPSLYINTDPARLNQVLTNLISNAIKYTKTGSVEVECESGREGLSIIIKDTGMGISAEDQKKLFTPFTRVGSVDQEPITGSGLGMWITSEIIKLLDGEVSLESIKGVGTHVRVKFPASIIASTS